MNFTNRLKLYFLEAFSKKAISDGLKQGFSLFALALGILCWVGFVVFMALLPTIYGVETGEDFSSELMIFALFSPFFLYALYLIINKKKRTELTRKVKSFAVRIFRITKVFGRISLILGGIILFFVILGAIFSWLIGLGVATLLVIIIIILLFK